MHTRLLMLTKFSHTLPDEVHPLGLIVQWRFRGGLSGIPRLPD